MEDLEACAVLRYTVRTERELIVLTMKSLVILQYSQRMLTTGQVHRANLGLRFCASSIVGKRHHYQGNL